MANTLLTIQMISQEHLRVLENNLVLAKCANRTYDKLWKEWGVKKGATVNLRKPIRVQATQGPALTVQSATETQVPVTLNQQPQVALEFASTDFTLSIDDFSNRFISPSAAQLANFIDFSGFQALTPQVYNMIGTPGTTPNSAVTYLQVGQRLAEESAPDDKLSLIISPAMNTQIVAGLAGLFNPQTAIAKQYQKGLMGNALGFDWYRSQNVFTQVFGSAAGEGAGTVNGAGQTGNSLITHGWTISINGLFAAGDVITVAGVHAVNHQSYQSTGYLRNFVVTAPVNSDAAGNATIPIYPAISVGPNNPFQTVDASPATGAAITPLGGNGVSSPQGLGLHRDAFAMVSADLVLPDYGLRERVADPEAGLSLRFVRQYDINTDNFPIRVDCLYGWAATYPELAVRVAS